MNKNKREHRRRCINRTLITCTTLISFAVMGSGCEPKLVVAYTDEREETVETLVAEKEERESNPPMQSCEMREPIHEIPKESLHGFGSYYREDGTLTALDFEHLTVSLKTLNGSDGWTQGLPIADEGTNVLASAKTPNSNPFSNPAYYTVALDNGIALGLVQNEAVHLVRINLEGSRLFDLNLTEALHLSTERPSVISLLEKDKDQNVLVVVSTQVLRENADKTFEEFMRIDEVTVASIAPDGTVAWKQTYPDKLFQPTHITVRRDGSYVLTGASEDNRSNSVLWFLDDQGALTKEYPLIDVVPEEGVIDSNDPLYSAELTALISVGTIEASNGTIYVVGSYSTNMQYAPSSITAIDGFGETVSFPISKFSTRPFFIIQLNACLGIDWSVFDAVSGLHGYALVTAHDFATTDSGSITIVSEFWGQIQLGMEQANEITLENNDFWDKFFWAKYNTNGEFLSGETLQSPFHSAGIVTVNNSELTISVCDETTPENWGLLSIEEINELKTDPRALDTHETSYCATLLCRMPQ